MNDTPTFHAARKDRGKWHRFEDEGGADDPYPACGGAIHWKSMTLSINDCPDWPPQGIPLTDCCKTCTESAQ